MRAMERGNVQTRSLLSLAPQRKGQTVEKAE